MKPVDVKPSTYIESSKGVNYQDLNLKLVIQLEYQNIKTFLQKAMFLGLKKVKNTVPWIYVVSDLKREEINNFFVNE